MGSTGLETTIVTPEGVELSYEPAGFVSRALAAALDLLILLAGAWVLAVVFALQSAGSDPSGLEVIFFVLISVCWIVGYPIVMEVQRQGRTIGKSALGIRVITINGLPLRLRHSFTRSALGLVELYMSAGCIASLAAVSNRHGQRVGDFAAGTLVVRSPSLDLNSGPMRFSPPTHMETFAESLDVSSIDAPHHDVLRSYLLRYYDFSESAQELLADEICASLASELQVERPPLMSKAVFLSCLAAKYQLSNTSLVLPGAQKLAISSAAARKDFVASDVSSLLSLLEAESAAADSGQEP